MSAGSDVAVLLKGEVVTFKPSELVLVDRESEQKPGDQARVAEAEGEIFVLTSIKKVFNSIE